ncbi:hypothetical protein ACIO3O_37490, partial [Streptomyces sp. NPDC087440]|uniref:hypothetical protein n=1 Tax=Streptomyces sp. NPDC087440 TaxID=3365790 RepID=UPI00380C7969
LRRTCMNTEPTPALPPSLSLWPEDYVPAPQDIEQRLVDVLTSDEALTADAARHLVDAHRRHLLNTMPQESS